MERCNINDAVQGWTPDTQLPELGNKNELSMYDEPILWKRYLYPLLIRVAALYC